MKTYGSTQVKVPVNIEVYIDRSYSMEILPPVTSDLIKWKAGINAGAAEPNKLRAGSVSRADLEELIDIKLPVMNTRNRDSILKSFMGTAKSL